MVLVSFIDPPITLAMHSILVIRPVQIIADAGSGVSVISEGPRFTAACGSVQTNTAAHAPIAP